MPTHKRFAVDRTPPIDDGGGGPHDPHMEQRVARLENDVGEIKATLGRLEPMLARMSAEFTEFRKDMGEFRKDMGEFGKGMGEFRKDMAKTREDMARIDGRVSQLPTTWQLLTGVVGIIGFVFLLLRFGLPH